MANVSASELAALEASLLNKSGNVPLDNRFRALFTLKSLNNQDAIQIISEGKTIFRFANADMLSNRTFRIPR